MHHPVLTRLPCCIHMRVRSREKVRLTDQLTRAEATVARCREAIREALRYVEEGRPGRCIPDSAYDSDGEVDVAQVVCAVCSSGACTDDNDLLLCDGDCGRAYHEACMSPRVVAAELPPDDGWLCPHCDAKVCI